MTDPFADLPKHHFGAILADPPWQFKVWGDQANSQVKHAGDHYETMACNKIASLSVQSLAADDCVLFIWISWPFLLSALRIIENWDFSFKTCAFAWVKAHVNQIDMFHDDVNPLMGSGYWTRANSEVCLLATRGKPKRLNADVRQGIIAPRREHSRKPEGVHERIERLVAGPYLELFARQSRPGWTVWGNETNKFKAAEMQPAIGVL